MITFEQIQPEDLQPLVALAYWEDYELLEKYHVRKFGSVEAAVEQTVIMIAEMEMRIPMNYYKIMWNGGPAGYMVTFENCLYSFGIKMQYRLRHILTEWVAKVQEMMEHHFKCYLYKNNTRAIEFCKKQGMIIIEENLEENFVTLLNNYSCQS